MLKYHTHKFVAHPLSLLSLALPAVSCYKENDERPGRLGYSLGILCFAAQRFGGSLSYFLDYQLAQG